MRKAIGQVAEIISRFVIDNSVSGQNFKDAYGTRLSDVVHNSKGAN